MILWNCEMLHTCFWVFTPLFLINLILCLLKPSVCVCQNIKLKYLKWTPKYAGINSSKVMFPHNFVNCSHGSLGSHCLWLSTESHSAGVGQGVVLNWNFKDGRVLSPPSLLLFLLYPSLSPSLLALSPSPQAHTPSPPCFVEQSTQEHIPRKRKKKVKCFPYVLIPIVQILQGE